MRKINMFLVIGMLVTFLIHGIMGALGLYGANADAMKAVGWVCAGFILCHVVITAMLTIETLRARKKSGAGYFKDNLMFWTRRISGFLILVPLVMHLTIFHSSNPSVFRLKEFTTGRMISQILLVAVIGLHILTNIRPGLIAFGIPANDGWWKDLLFILSVVLLFLMGAFIVYYLRWTTN